MSVSQPTSPPVLLDMKAVAGRLGCSVQHIRRMHDRGAMPPAVEIGSLRRWSSETISEWIRDGCPRHHRQAAQP